MGEVVSGQLRVALWCSLTKVRLYRGWEREVGRAEHWGGEESKRATPTESEPSFRAQFTFMDPYAGAGLSRPTR